MIRSSKKTQQRRRMILALDADAREQVFERDGGLCVRCGDRTRVVQWCHIFSRTHRNLRWETDNALSMCGGCHLWWHKEPLLAIEWFRKTWPERYEWLLEMFNAGGKVNVKELFEAL